MVPDENSVSRVDERDQEEGLRNRQGVTVSEKGGGWTRTKRVVS